VVVGSGGAVGGSLLGLLELFESVSNCVMVLLLCLGKVIRNENASRVCRGGRARALGGGRKQLFVSTAPRLRGGRGLVLVEEGLMKGWCE
jgi:hypothetical protein